MAWLISKYFTTSAIVVAVSEIAKRSDRLGALLAALPTLPMFLLFPVLLARIGFWPTLIACAAITAALFMVLCKSWSSLGLRFCKSRGLMITVLGD